MATDLDNDARMAAYDSGAALHLVAAVALLFLSWAALIATCGVGCRAVAAAWRWATGN